MYRHKLDSHSARKQEANRIRFFFLSAAPLRESISLTARRWRRSKGLTANQGGDC
jgi:hypothetical protein